MLIQVPLFSESLSQIKRPLTPSDPPTSQDIVDAIFLLEKVKEFFGPPSFERRLRRDYCMATVDDLAKAQLYLHKVCSAATAEKGGNSVISHLVEPMDRRLDQKDETLVRMMNNPRIHGLEQRLDSDSQISEHRQRSGNPEAPERSPVESTHWLYDKTQPFNDLQLYHQIPISWGSEDKDPEHFKLPPLRTNNDFTNLPGYQLDSYLYYYRIDIDKRSTRETKMHCLRYFIIGCSKSCLAASCDLT